MKTHRTPVVLVALVLLAFGATPSRAQTHDGYRLPEGWHPPVHDRMTNWHVLFEKLELRAGEAEDAAVIDAHGWVGGDYNRFWWKLDGEHGLRSPKSGDVEVQALYGRLFSPFWDFQAGVKLDRRYTGPGKETRGHLALGLQGIAPYWFELEPTVFVSDDGDVTFALSASYEQLITQRWVIEPRVDLSGAFQEDSARRVGRGVNEVEFEFRVRYDITRQIGPYMGVTWRRALGDTGRWRQLGGERKSEGAVVFGVRAWF